MRAISKTEFTALSSARLTAINDVLEIVSVKTRLGYFVPTEIMGQIRCALNYAKTGHTEMAKAFTPPQIWHEAQPDAGEGE
jgi:hypothetical protein